MSLDEAVKRFVELYSGYLEAKEKLIEEMLKAGASKRTARNFVKNLEDNVRLGKRKMSGPEDEPKAKTVPKTEPVEKSEPPKDEKPAKKKTNAKVNPVEEFVKAKMKSAKRTKPPKRNRLVEPGHFEWDAERGKYTYNLDGKSKVGKYLPLYKFRNTTLGFYDGDEFALMFEGKSGRQKIDEGIALAQVRTLIRELEANELEPGEVEVYENFINGVKSRMRPLARDMFNQLLNSYHAWKNHRG